MLRPCREVLAVLAAVASSLAVAAAGTGAIAADGIGAVTADGAGAVRDRPQATDPAFEPIADVAGLPRVLLIGDSISMGYTIPTRRLLDGKANVHRIPVNGGPTTRGLEQLESWLGSSAWDVIHFNFGLHDLKHVDESGAMVDATAGRRQVEPDTYRENLTAIVRRLKRTGATLIWCTTTPVPEGSRGRVPGDELAYNAVAAEVMRQEGVEINDLYAFAAPRMAEIGRPANVHYTAAGSEVLAREVARRIEAALPR